MFPLKNIEIVALTFFYKKKTVDIMELRFKIQSGEN